MAYGPDKRRSFCGRKLDARGRRRLPEHQRAGGVYLRPACRHLVFWPRLQRADTDKAGLRIRAGYTPSTPAEVFAHRRSSSLESLIDRDDRAGRIQVRLLPPILFMIFSDVTLEESY